MSHPIRALMQGTLNPAFLSACRQAVVMPVLTITDVKTSVALAPQTRRKLTETPLDIVGAIREALEENLPSDAEPEEWERTVELARERHDTPTPNYLLSEPLLSEFWEEGAERLGRPLPLGD